MWRHRCEKYYFERFNKIFNYLVFLSILQFYELLMAAEAKKLISVDDIANLKATTAAGTQWQADHLKGFERDFFTGKCTESKNQ